MGARCERLNARHASKVCIEEEFAGRKSLPEKKAGRDAKSIKRAKQKRHEPEFVPSLYDKGENDELCCVQRQALQVYRCDLPRAAPLIVYMYYYIRLLKKVNYFGEKIFLFS